MIALDDDEMRFKSVINLLKNVAKIDAPPGFEADLMRKINSENFYETNKVRWWQKILSPSLMIPSTAALAVVIIFFAVNINSFERENPFLTIPKMRETLNSENNIKMKDIPKQNPGFTEASLNQSFTVNKDGLNFLQVRLTEAEKNKINRLKSQIREYFKGNRSGK